MRHKKFVAVIVLVVAVMVVGLKVYAQAQRPYRNGSVWSVTFVRMKPGMDTAYLNYLSGDWKQEQEAYKKAGYVLSYKVLATEGHSPTDFNLMLLTEYKNLAAFEANEQKMDELSQKLFGDDDKQRKGYEDRTQIRDIMGDRLAREIVLEPRTASATR